MEASLESMELMELIAPEWLPALSSNFNPNESNNFNWSTESGNGNESESESESQTKAFIDYTAVVVILAGIYGLIFVLGIVGNVMVLIAVIRNKQMHTVANILISNLATADLLMAATCVPVTPVMTFMKKWSFGELLCHVIPMTSAVSVYVNTLTGIIIAIDRYIVIVHPLTRNKLSPKSTVVLICAVW